MSTTYTANPGATQAPADPPRAGTAPKVTLPADGDALTAASVAQMAKEPVDQIAFLQSPAANSTVLDQDIWAGAQDANSNLRLGIDHWGFQRRAQIDWTEDWTPDAQFIGGAITAPKWAADCIGAASVIGSLAPGTTVGGTTVPNPFRGLTVTIDGSGGSNRSAIGRAPGASSSVFADDTLAIMDVWAKPLSVLSTKWVVGFATAGEAVNVLQNAVYFSPVSGFWNAVAISGGTSTAVASAVAYNTTGHWFRIVWVGKNLDDGQVAARALFYIDGTRVANVITNLPNNTGKVILPTVGGYLTSTVANPILLAGPLRYRQITTASTATV